MPATTTSPLIETGKASLEFARRYTLDLLEGIPADQLIHQPVPNTNHALWIAGHIGWTDDFIMSTLRDQPSTLPEDWTKLFGTGSTPQPDASAYPSLDELKTALAEQRAALMKWFESMDEATLLSSLPEDWKSFAPTYAALMAAEACHECSHAGQLTVVRRSLGLPPRF